METNQTFENEFLQETIHIMEYSLKRIVHCLNQLNDTRIWWRPHEHANSIGIIINHLCGNLRQWIISGVGGAIDIRNRPQEFKDNYKLTKNELISQLTETIEECKVILKKCEPVKLLEKRRIQSFDNTLLSAIYGTITHLELHAGQIIYITRSLLKDQYQYLWEPQTKEQGAE
ncbi:MAG: DUF1572 family protein [Sedimentisphaerales bacterium]|nr:DUF1572 family protein [Sedimentisphaerales bacterium]